MNTQENYDEAVRTIKSAILQSQYDAAKSVNEKQLVLYYCIGKYISNNSRKGYWGKSAIDTISERLDKELPGLKGFSARNLRYMRTFYEEWQTLDNLSYINPQSDSHNLKDASDKLTLQTSEDNVNLALASAKLEHIYTPTIWHSQMPKDENFPFSQFFSIGFTHHRIIFEKIKNINERYFYIHHCAEQKYSVEALKRSIANDDYHHQSSLPNNFLQTLTPSQQALKAITTFKDEYLLDFINVEELNIRDIQDSDEKVVENAIVHNIKNFILTFGKDFAFVRNQYHLDAFGEDQYIDLLFFNRGLNCLVAVELKTGKFKTSYLGQLSGYLSILDQFEKKPHENPSIGIILCKEMNASFVDFVIRDYSKPMGVATYKTSKDMSDELKKALPNIDDLKKLLENE